MLNRSRLTANAERSTTMVLSAFMLTAALDTAFAADPIQVWEETHKYCEKKPDGTRNPCGAIGLGNGGGYNVARVEVESRDNEWDDYPQCSGVSMSDANDLSLNQYGVFIVPAPCAYKVTIKIAAGDTKSNKVLLTPGCALGLKADGTTTQNNKPRLHSVKWTDEAKAQYAKKGVTVSNDDVSDLYFHAATGSSAKHYCNLLEKANKNPKD